MNNELRANPPKGVSLEYGSANVFAIDHKSSGMGCMKLFLFVWLAGWSCFLAVIGYSMFMRLFEGKLGEAGVMLLLFLVWLFFECAVLYYLVLTSFARRRFLFDEENLVTELSFLKWKKLEVCPRRGITQVIQHKDGGEDDDSFPSWGLKVAIEGQEKQPDFLQRQPYQVSLWLGQVIADWSGAPFTIAPPPDVRP